MKNDFVPILVQTEGKKELWRIDVSNLSVTELVKLKEELVRTPYEKTIVTLDAIIKQSIESITPSNGVDKTSYMRNYKKNKKEQKMLKKSKIRRRYK